VLEAKLLAEREEERRKELLEIAGAIEPIGDHLQRAKLTTLSDAELEGATQPAVPAQPQGTTIHYEVHAANDVPAGTVLGFLSYDVPWEVDIAAIQGMGPASPYGGETVLTGGVATAAFGSYFVIQDGAGGWNGIWARSSAPVAASARRSSASAARAAGSTRRVRCRAPG